LKVFGRSAYGSRKAVTSGIYKDSKGNKVLDVTLGESILKGIGFQPNSVAKVQNAASEVFQMKDVYNVRRAELTGQMARALFEADHDEMRQVPEAVKRWNEDNAETPIRLNMPSIISKVKTMREDKATRLERTSPKGMRETVRKQMSEAHQ
jgi:hypothetical protein